MGARCSVQSGYRCTCPPDAPAVGTPLYAERRAHPDAGDLEALEIVTNWVKDGGPFLHLRYADGEFYSILGAKGVNSDGLAFDSGTLGVELHQVLDDISSGALSGTRALIGGDWTRPEAAVDYLHENGFLRGIPWCPSGIWVNGVTSGHLARFFEALLADPRPRVLIGNNRIRGAAAFLRAKFVEVPASASWSVRKEINAVLATIAKNSVVMYCAGMATEAFAWASWKWRQDLTHLDMGHIFDGAFGVRSRVWLSADGKCVRRDTYFSRYAPVMRGEKESFGEF